MTLAWSPRRWIVTALSLSVAVALMINNDAAKTHLQISPPPRAVEKPKVPLSSESRWIVDLAGRRVKMRCINWAGHMEVNIPEGLDKTTIASVADWIAAEGFNCVRLTYSIDMALKPDLPVRDSFRQAAQSAAVDEAAVMTLYDRAVAKNPFLADAAVIDVFDRVVALLWDRGVMTVLDNHVSRAAWCCNLDDGNGWWSDVPVYAAENSRFFNTDDWMAGLRAMARWSRDRDGVVAMSLRNEPRAAVTQLLAAAASWLDKMVAAAAAVHETNPDLLVIMAGLHGGTDLSLVRSVDSSSSAWAPGKRVWEAHAYSFTPTTPSAGICFLDRAEMGALYGFVLEQGHPYTGPLFMSEFGVDMAGGPEQGLSKQEANWLRCLVEWFDDNDTDWALWAIQGSYYIREGRVDFDETWGAMDFQWSGWRNPHFKGMLSKMFEVAQGP